MLIELDERLVGLQLIKSVHFLQLMQLELDCWSLIIILWDSINQVLKEISSLPELSLKFAIFLVKVVDLPDMCFVH